MEEKNKRTNTDLDQLQAQEGGSLCDTFVQLSLHLQAIAGVYFAWNFHKAIRNADSSFIALLPTYNCLLLLPVSFSGQLPQANCSLRHPLALSVFSGTFLPSSTSGLAGDFALVCGFRAKTDRVSLTGDNTNGNECYLLYHTSGNFFFVISKVKLATIVEDDPKAPFSIATTPRCRGGRYSIPRIAPLYPWTVPYNAEC